MTMPLTDDPRIYVRVYVSVKNDIVAGNLAPGKPIPPITVLCQEHGGSRQTIAKALRMLEDDAWLICYPGIGYCVAPEAVSIINNELARDRARLDEITSAATGPLPAFTSAHEEQLIRQLAAQVGALEAENERLRGHHSSKAPGPCR